MQVPSITQLALIAALVIPGCGPKPGGTSGAAGPGGAVSSASGAAHWIPAKPTYVVSAHTFRDAQRALRDLADSLGSIGGGAAALSRQLTNVLAFDPLSPEAATAIGIDVDGELAMFSEALTPTFVAHLAAPEALGSFLDKLRAKGMVTQSVVVDGTEVFTADLGGHKHVSWAVAADWLWVHFGGAKDTDTRWFTGSHVAAAATWAADWAWAAASAHPGAVTGFAHVRDLATAFADRIPEALACMQMFQGIGRAGVTIDGDGHHVGGSLSFDLGAAAPAVAAHVLPTPDGWTAASTGAALAVQWNLDLDAVRAQLAPCAQSFGVDLGMFASYGVRSARATLASFSSADTSFTGVASLDLSSGKWLRDQLDGMLDKIGPMRRLIEHDHTFGPYAGHTLSIPSMPSVDYVLTDKIGLAAVGDGLLAKAIGGGGAAPAPVAAFDIVPSVLSVDSWRTLLSLGGLGGRDAAEHIMAWRDGHIAVRIDRDRLVIEAHGDRR